MTGFGSSEGLVGTLRVTVEIRAVNHRFFNPSLKLPASMGRWEGDVREALRKRFARGHITIAAWADRGDETTSVTVDEERIGAYVTQLRAVRDRFGLAGDVDLATVLRLPEVFSTASASEELPESPDALLAIVMQAADALSAMRRSEGEQVERFFRERLAVVASALDRIEARAPERIAEQRDRMQTSIAELAGGIAIDPQRLTQEVAILADRLDIAEELSRFRGHLEAFRATLDTPAGEAVGKRLGFVLQEMLREANTTGSKANDAAIVADVVLIKEELERLREQVENVE